MDLKDFDEELVYSSVEDFNNKFSKKHGLIVLHVNIRSINCNINNLKLFLERLSVSPDVIVCSESRVPKFDYDIEGYCTLHFNESTINICDGVIMYVISSLKNSVNVSTEVCGSTRFLCANICLNDKQKLKISAIYRCHDLKKPNFITELKNHLDNNKHVNDHFLIGDFNIDIIQPDSDGQLFLNNFLENEYFPAINSITRDNDSGGGSCIDNFFCKTKNLSYQGHKIHHKITDHVPIILEIEVKNLTRSKPTNSYFIDYKKLNGYLNDSLSYFDVNNYENIDDALQSLISKIQSNIDLCKKPKTTKNRRNNPRKPWITPGLIVSSQTKDKLYKDWQKDINNLELKKNLQFFQISLKNFLIRLRGIMTCMS